MEIIMKSIGERIRDRRKELHLTQTDIKAACGISSGALSEIENGNRTPSVIIFHALSEVLQCSMDWLATGESSETEKAAISASEDFKSNTEEELLKGFRQLDQDDQNELMGLLALKLRKVKRDGEKMETLSNSDDGEASDKLA